MNPPHSRPLFTILFSLFTAALCAASASAAAFSPLQIGAGWPAPAGFELQLVPEKTPVFGFRLNLPGSVNDTVAGLDFGIYSEAETFSGIRLNVFSGSKTLNGVAVAFMDVSEEVRGVQIGGLNLALHEVRGAQIGLLNFTYSLRGVQIGILNFAEYLHGVQIGLFNVTESSGFSPLLRVAF